MGASYHQFCPVAKAMELLDERWTLLIIRELLSGSGRFNDLRRGVPKMSPTLLSKRLGQLVRAGIVTRVDDDRGVGYALTPAGTELLPVIEGLGAWGMRWTGRIGDADLDPKLLMWDLHRNVDPDLLPERRTVVMFEFPDVAARERRWWMVLDSTEVDICDDDPGHEVGAWVSGRLRHLVEIWRGDRSWSAALRSGDVTVTGAEAVRHFVPRWFPPSRFAAVPRPGPSAVAG
jgi:DNA-binding HxlR family transcriptional regulator